MKKKNEEAPGKLLSKPVVFRPFCPNTPLLLIITVDRPLRLDDNLLLLPAAAVGVELLLGAAVAVVALLDVHGALEAAVLAVAVELDVVAAARGRARAARAVLVGRAVVGGRLGDLGGGLAGDEAAVERAEERDVDAEEGEDGLHGAEEDGQLDGAGEVGGDVELEDGDETPDGDGDGTGRLSVSNGFLGSHGVGKGEDHVRNTQGKGRRQSQLLRRLHLQLPDGDHRQAHDDQIREDVGDDQRHVDRQLVQAVAARDRHVPPEGGRVADEDHGEAVPDAPQDDEDDGDGTELLHALADEDTLVEDEHAALDEGQGGHVEQLEAQHDLHERRQVVQDWREGSISHSSTMRYYFAPE